MKIKLIGLCTEPLGSPKPPEPSEKQQEKRSRSRKKPKVENFIAGMDDVNEIVYLDDDNDDFRFCCTPKSNKGNTKQTAISVERYSEERDLNLAIMASLKSTTKAKPIKQENFVDLSQDNQDFCYLDDKDDIRVLKFKPGFTTFKRGRTLFVDSVNENGQSSKSQNDREFVCEICVEPKSFDESFTIKGCTHSYCRDCMAKYVASKLQDNITYIPCPVSGCVGLLEPEHCRLILPQEVFDRWGNALCEALIPGSEKFYCPYKDCSALLIADGREVVRESECPNCFRMFCAQCKVPWHSGIECQAFRKLPKDEREREDIMLMKLAENKNWRRCPKCRIFVERTQGCKFMKCRCGAAFCYTCGTSKIGDNHYCSYCKG